MRTAKKEPIQDEQITQPLKEKDIINIQVKDSFCSKIIKQLENKKAVGIHPTILRIISLRGMLQITNRGLRP